MLDTINLNQVSAKIENAARLSLGRICRIKRKRHEEKLEDYLNLGRFISEARKEILSDKLLGQYVKAALPESKALQPSLRSNSKWLYEALNDKGSKGTDILEVSGVATMADYFTANPSTIRRKYNDKKKAMGKTSRTPAGTPVNEATVVAENIDLPFAKDLDQQSHNPTPLPKRKPKRKRKRT